MMEAHKRHKRNSGAGSVGRQKQHGETAGSGPSLLPLGSSRWTKEQLKAVRSIQKFWRNYDKDYTSRLKRIARKVQKTTTQKHIQEICVCASIAGSYVWLAYVANALCVYYRHVRPVL